MCLFSPSVSSPRSLSGHLTILGVAILHRLPWQFLLPASSLRTSKTLYHSTWSPFLNKDHWNSTSNTNRIGSNGRPLHDWGFVSVVVSHLLALLERAQETQYWAPTVSGSKPWPLPLCSMDHEGSLCQWYPSSLSLWNSGHYRLRIFSTSLVEQDSDLNSLVKGLSLLKVCSG